MIPSVRQWEAAARGAKRSHTMKKRLLCLGLVAAAVQLFASGCHPVARWRANHPCAACHPCLHPIKSHRAMIGAPIGPMVTDPPCHGCNGGAPGVPVTFHGAPGDLVPTAAPPVSYPNIGYPKPIVPGGPTVVPQYELPNPMPVPKNTGG
jgi:hypothetical protein